MKRWNIVAAVGMLFPPSLVIGLYTYIGSFNRMLGDDYCTTYMAQRLGLLRSIWYWYKSWHGRFSANVADWLISLSGPDGFRFYTLIFISIWVVFAIIAAKAALDYRGYSSFKLFAALLLAVFLVFTTLRLTPDVIESLFWWGGVRSYLAPLILIVLYFAFYYRFAASSLNRIQTSLWLFVSFGFAFFIGGFSETSTPVLVLFLAGVTGLTLLISRFNLKAASTLFLSAGFVGALLSLFVMVLAPGNSIRREYFPVPPDTFTILRVALAGYFSFLYDVFRSPYTLAGLLGSMLGSVWLGMRMKRESDVATPRGWWILIVLLAGFVLAFGSFPTAVYATSEPPPERTLIVPAFILVVCFLVSGFVFGEWLISRVKKSLVLTPTLLLVACGLITYSSYGSFQYLYSMRAEHISFARQWDQVDAEIRDAKKSGLREVNIPALKNWAEAEYPTDNPRYWPNVCYSKFYEINIISHPHKP